MADEEAQQTETKESSDDINQRLAFPLLVPVVIFLFAVLVIYGLSRIYLELNTIKVGDVTMATPLAIGVSLYILLAAWYLASNRRVPMVQVAGIGMVAVFALTGGAIWAAVDDRGEEDGHENTVTETPVATDPGEVAVSLIDPEWAIIASPDPVALVDGELTFNVTNDGVSVHNVRLAQTGLDADALPLDSTGLQVDEENLAIVYSSADLSAGGDEQGSAALEAGSYVLFCNIAGHYDSGMYTTLTVE